MTQGNTLPEIAVVACEGEPRALDSEIAERLGFSRSRKVRDLIERHRGELEGFGVITPHRGAKPGPGRPKLGYLLNEEQALLIATVSNAPNAPAVRSMLIRTFVAWRRGHLASPAITKQEHGGITKSVVRAALGDMVPEILFEALALVLPDLVTHHLEADTRAVAIGYKPALAVLIDKKVPTRRRRAFSQKVSARLRRFSAVNGHPFRISRETGRYLFHVDAINAWLATEGEALIRDHVASLEGQGVLRLVQPRGPAA